MDQVKERTGQCLCGKVSYRLTEPVKDVGACHCSTCRRWTGGPFLALHCGAGGVKFGDENAISIYSSSEWAERGFCDTCGSNLFYRLRQSGEIFLLAGTLDDQSELEFVSQVFIEEKPAFYTFSNETKNMTGAELFALYAPEEGGKE